MDDKLPEVIFDPTIMKVGIVTYNDETAVIRWVNMRKPNLDVAVSAAEKTEIPKDVLRARLDDEYYLDTDDLLYKFLESA